MTAAAQRAKMHRRRAAVRAVLTLALLAVASGCASRLDRVLDLLRQQYSSSGKQRLFEALKTCIAQGRREAGYSDLADDLGMTEAAVKVAVYRLRQRYRKRLRWEIAGTVSSSGEVEDEIRALFSAFQS